MSIGDKSDWPGVSLTAHIEEVIYVSLVLEKVHKICLFLCFAAQTVSDEHFFTLHMICEACVTSCRFLDSAFPHFYPLAYLFWNWPICDWVTMLHSSLSSRLTSSTFLLPVNSTAKLCHVGVSLEICDLVVRHGRGQEIELEMEIAKQDVL